MQEEIIIAGFGGQGILSLGMTLAYAGMVEDKQVSWMPSYGPEMRGGTANCTVIISDTAVSSPIINRCDSLLIFNQPSLEKFEPALNPGGRLIYESNNVLKPPTRGDIAVYGIPAVMEAVLLKEKRTMNMIVLGAYLALNAVVGRESILEALSKVLPARHHHLIPLNKQALQRGRELVQDLVPAEK